MGDCELDGVLLPPTLSLWIGWHNDPEMAKSYSYIQKYCRSPVNLHLNPHPWLDNKAKDYSALVKIQTTPDLSGSPPSLWILIEVVEALEILEVRTFLLFPHWQYRINATELENAVHRQHYRCACHDILVVYLVPRQYWAFECSTHPHLYFYLNFRIHLNIWWSSNYLLNLVLRVA